MRADPKLEDWCIQQEAIRRLFGIWRLRWGRWMPEDEEYIASIQRAKQISRRWARWGVAMYAMSIGGPLAVGGAVAAEQWVALGLALTAWAGVCLWGAMAIGIGWSIHVDSAVRDG